MPITANNSLIYRGDRPAGTTPEEIEANNLTAAEVDGNFKHLDENKEPKMKLVTLTGLNPAWVSTDGQHAIIPATAGNINLVYSPDSAPVWATATFYQQGNRTLTINGQSVEVDPTVDAVTGLGLLWDGITLKIYSDYSITTENPGATQLATPSINAVVISDTQIDITLGSVDNASSYVLQWSANGSTGWTQLATVAGTFEHTGLTPETTYYYRAWAIGDGTNYTNSAIASDFATTEETAVEGPPTAHHSTFTGSAMGLASYTPEIGDPWVMAEGQMNLDGNGNIVLSAVANGNVTFYTPISGRNLRHTIKGTRTAGQLEYFLRWNYATGTYIYVLRTGAEIQIKVFIENAEVFSQSFTPVDINTTSGLIVDVVNNTIEIYNENETTGVITLPASADYIGENFRFGGTAMDAGDLTISEIKIEQL